VLKWGYHRRVAKAAWKRPDALAFRLAVHGSQGLFAQRYSDESRSDEYGSLHRSARPASGSQARRICGDHTTGAEVERLHHEVHLQEGHGRHSARRDLVQAETRFWHSPGTVVSRETQSVYARLAAIPKMQRARYLQEALSRTPHRNERPGPSNGPADLDADHLRTMVPAIH